MLVMKRQSFHFSEDREAVFAETLGNTIPYNVTEQQARVKHYLRVTVSYYNLCWAVNDV
jgi:hypothetical protein